MKKITPKRSVKNAPSRVSQPKISTPEPLDPSAILAPDEAVFLSDLVAKRTRGLSQWRVSGMEGMLALKQQEMRVLNAIVIKLQKQKTYSEKLLSEQQPTAKPKALKFDSHGREQIDLAKEFSNVRR